MQCGEYLFRKCALEDLRRVLEELLEACVVQDPELLLLAQLQGLFRILFFELKRLTFIMGFISEASHLYFALSFEAERRQMPCDHARRCLVEVDRLHLSRHVQLIEGEVLHAHAELIVLLLVRLRGLVVGGLKAGSSILCGFPNGQSVYNRFSSALLSMHRLQMHYGLTPFFGAMDIGCTKTCSSCAGLLGRCACDFG